MKKSIISCLMLSVLFIGCIPEPEPETDQLVGQDGDPRFNLQFSNHNEVDLDIYVQTPDGSIISWLNPFSNNGQLDVDCLCGDCANGGNENIFWYAGSAPSGTYRYWVEYYESCSGSPASSDFTLRVVKNNQIIKTQQGRLSGGKSQVWTHVQD
ncbi:hypothetical protein [Cognataquiflexum rubidum]|uniref:hypothetical protein n=1 Tax=Cognataquiflexum rubidum TaxID=2922273 RepID=UPI001F12C73C|nr:hypothetical protein [Cognataquiflexum rubidum]MCH6232477.1 hypothetical protein [Cognataquiflexum rubidum]